MAPKIRHAVTVFIMFALLSVPLTVPTMVDAGDQAHSMVDFFANPDAQMVFHAVAWNEMTYQYAIAVGHNYSSGNDEIYRYEAGRGWTQIYASSSDKYDDVIFDPSSNDRFYVSGSRDSSSLVLKVESADAVPSISVLGPSPGDEIYALSIDTQRGTMGYLVGVGTGDDGSGNTGGMIMVHDLSEPGDIWSTHYTGADQVLTDVTFNDGATLPLFIAVGSDNSIGKGVAYAYNYSGFWPIDVPDTCTRLTSVSWYEANPDGYALAVGQDASGNGLAYRINVNFPGTRVAYTYTRSPYSVRYMYGSNEAHFSTPVALAHANFTSIALSPGGLPRIAYYDNQTHHLMYAYYHQRVWRSVPVDTVGDVGMYCSLAIDHAGIPYISYYDRTNGYLKMAWYDNGWKTEVIDGSGTAGKYTDLIIDDQGHFHISYLDTSAGVKYAYYDGTQWSIEVAASEGNNMVSLALDSNDHPHIAYAEGEVVRYVFNDGSGWQHDNEGADSFSGLSDIDLVLNNTDTPHIFIFFDTNGIRDKHKEGSTWVQGNIQISSSTSRYAHEGVAIVEPNDDIELFYSYVDKSISLHTVYSLNYTKMDAETKSWSDPIPVDAPYMGGAPSAVFLDTFQIYMEELSPVDTSVPPRAFLGVDWCPDGSQATIVGDNGEVYLYYNGKSTISLWNGNGPADLYDVAVKPPGSPSYSLAVGSSNSAIISTQVADTSTTISAGAHTPHINDLDFLDAHGISRLNQQVDVGAQYTFRMNTSYMEGWGKIAINITGWYDFYDGTSEKGYNDTLGENYNFKVHFEPDPVDPYNRSGNCTLLWPRTEEVRLVTWHIDVIDNQADGALGVNDGKDNYIVSIVLNFGQQLAYASGEGSWTPAGDQSNPSSALNDHYSWNFNMTIYDRSAPASRESKYDEFGIFAYTEISAQGSPAGSGVPGSTVSLSPSSRIYIRTNVPYTVTVNITDLKNETGGSYIPRDYVEVLNYNPAGDNTTSNTDLHDWTAFPTSPDPLYVWGTSGGDLMWPLLDGTYTAGYQAGYSSSPVYTTVMWRIHIPPGLGEDTFSATITYSIDYQV